MVYKNVMNVIDYYPYIKWQRELEWLMISDYALTKLDSNKIDGANHIGWANLSGGKRGDWLHLCNSRSLHTSLLSEIDSPCRLEMKNILSFFCNDETNFSYFNWFFFSLQKRNFVS